jgi:hypothetical protein
MENSEQHHDEHHKSPKPIEHNYSAHESDPGPAPQAINEDDNKGAGLAMKWVIPIVIVILLIIYWIMF